MRPPYLQVETNFITGKAPLVAAFAGIQPALALGHSVLLFDFAVTSTSTKEKPPDGVFLDPDAATILEVAVGWTGESGKLFAAFVRAGAIEKLDVGARVKGLDRYADVWAAAKVRAAKAKAAADKRWGRTPQEMPDECSSDARSMLGACSADAQPMLETSKTKTKTKTEIEKKKEETSPSAAPLRPSFDWLATTQRFRAEVFPSAMPDDPESGRFLAWWKQASALASPEALLDAYRAYLADPWASGLPQPCPWGIWQSQWKRHVPGQSGKVPAEKPKRSANGF